MAGVYYFTSTVPCKFINDEDIPNDIEMILFELLLKTRKWLYVDHHPKTKITFLIFFQKAWSIHEDIQFRKLALICF